MRLVVATRNQHKLGELAAVLESLELVALPDGVALPPETGTTFEQNALAKAQAAAHATSSAAIADDSGIEASALAGAPGLRSARFAGEQASDSDNLDKLLRAVARHGDRSVAYVCVLAFVAPDGAEACFEGRCEGTLALAPRGEGGFGYDPAFLPHDIGGERTIAELSPAEKHAISHRGRAARAFLAWLERRAPPP